MQYFRSRRRRQLDNGDNIISFGPDLPLKDFLSDLDVTSFLPSLSRPNPQESDVCHEENEPCDPRTPYRSYSGHCNNLERTNLGRSVTTFARLLPSVYENGKWFTSLNYIVINYKVLTHHQTNKNFNTQTVLIHQ